MATTDYVFHKCSLSLQSSSDQKQALAFCLELVQQELATGSDFQSPLLSFMAMHSLKRQGAWCLPNDYWLLLNWLCYRLQLTLLGSLHCEWLHFNKN
jgi:hypothetical protein